MIREYLKENLSIKNKKKIRNFLNDLKAIGKGSNLNRLGEIYGTDKVGDHNYTECYSHHFKKFKYKKIKLFEIGVGGYKDPFAGGESLRMWKKYFPFGKIYSLDIYNKTQLQEKRIKIFKGSQVDKKLLSKITDEIKKADIIIDDGSHINNHVIETFKILFPVLKNGGIYVIEDTQTSYWKEYYGGNSENLNDPNTMMGFFKNLTDSMNNKEIIRKVYQQTYYDKKIISMHFYHNLIFIYKGNNNKDSNTLVNNQFP